MKACLALSLLGLCGALLAEDIVPAVAWHDGQYLVVWQGFLDDIYGVRVDRQLSLLDSAVIPIARSGRRKIYPELASDDTNYLALWCDFTLGKVYGARVSSAGTVLDPDGFCVTTGRPGWQGNPHAAFNGSNYLVAWQDGQPGEDNDIYAARLSPDGRVIDSAGICLCAWYAHQCVPRVATNGTDFLVVWNDQRNDPYYYDIYAARVTADGAVLDPDGFPVCMADYSQHSANVAFDGVNYLTVWSDGRRSYDRIYAARITPGGNVLDDTGLAVSTRMRTHSFPAVAPCGSNLLLVWQEISSSTLCDIYGARISPAGAVLDTQGIVICSLPGSQWTPAVADDGTNCLAVWEDEIDETHSYICGARVTPLGEVLDPGGVPISFPVGITQEKPVTPAAEPDPAATIVRGVLRLPPLLSPPSSLLSVDGRKVLSLEPGANDVSRLSPGVYFVREARAQAVRRVVVTR
jgi:hypothetical protein